MNDTCRETLLLSWLVTCIAAPAAAADRVRAGQWEMTLNVAGRTMTRTVCLSQSDADAINGDLKSIRAKAEKDAAAGGGGCTVTDVRTSGNQVIVTSVCGGKENVGTTTYHGDTLETVNTNGTKAQSKWVGACK
jgi:hypothetical protein